jgi:hypothetical protein
LIITVPVGEFKIVGWALHGSAPRLWQSMLFCLGSRLPYRSTVFLFHLNFEGALSRGQNYDTRQTALNMLPSGKDDTNASDTSIIKAQYPVRQGQQ